MIITLKGSKTSGWYAPPRGTHSGEKHRAVGSGKSVVKRKRGALQRMMSEKNLGDLTIDERGIAYARDQDGNNMTVFGYNPKTRHMFASAFSHATGQHIYLPNESYDDFVKIIRMSDAGPGVPAITVYIDRHAARDATDAWNKSFDAAKALGRIGFPANTQVNLSSYTGSRRAQRLELGGL